MTRPMVLKFGGTSLGDAAAFDRVAGIVRAHGGPQPVVVASALSRVTDALVEACRAAAGPQADRALDGVDPHLERHREVARRLLAPGAAAAFETELARARAELAALVRRLAGEAAARSALEDEVLAYGERLSTALLAAVLAARGLPVRPVDARRVIVTDDRHGGATPLPADTERRIQDELRRVLGEGAIPVLAGYIAATPDGATTTLGRGGSDFSAALVGAALGAAEVQIWTDVSGVLSADPRIVRSARTVPRLSYAEAAELAYFGAKVLHPRTIPPAQDRGIPVRICNSHAPDDPGTLVTAEADIWPDTIKAIAHKTGVAVVRVSSARLPGDPGVLAALFEAFGRHGAPVDVVATSEVSVSLALADTAALPGLVAELSTFGPVSLERECAMICVVGEGLRRTPGVTARVFQTLGDVNVLLVSQGASQVNLTCVVREAHVAGAVGRLHEALLERELPGAAPAVLRGRAGTAPDVLALTRWLIDIPSPSGDEARIARAVAAYLSDLGYRVDLFDAAPGRPNLFATTGAPPRVVLCTHLDTVPPFIGSHDDGEFIYGRGACDSKGSLAAQIVAAERLRAEGVAELGLLFVVDEEMGSLGARAANAHPRARECRYVVVGEPTDNRLAVGSKGSLRLSLTTHGAGGHSAHPERGSSAIDRLLDVLAELRRAEWPRDEFFGDTSCNIGVITGGTRTNVIATDARADLHLRLVTDTDRVKRQLERLVDGRAEIEYLSVTPPVRLLGVAGFEQCVVGFTTDTAHLGHWGTALLLGPGSIGDAHTAQERIARAELARGVELYGRLVRSLLADGAARPRDAAATEASR